MVCIHLEFYANFKLKQLRMNFPRSLVAPTGGLFIVRKGEKQSCCRGGGSREVAKELARKFVLTDTMAPPLINLTEYIVTSSSERTPLSSLLSESQFDPAMVEIEWPGDIESGSSIGNDRENNDC